MFRTTILITVACLFFSQGQLAAETMAFDENEQTVTRQFLKILENRPREGTPLDKVYQHHRDNNSLDELIDQLETEASQSPNDDKKWLLLGLFLEKTGRNDDALIAYRHACELVSDDFYIRYYLGRFLLQNDMTTEAVESLELALNATATNETTPNVTEQLDAVIALGKTYAKLNDFQKFDQLLRRLAAMTQQDDIVLLNYVKTLEDEKHFDAAIERYSRIFGQLKPDSMAYIRCLLARADAKANARRKQEAISDYEAALNHVRANESSTEATYDRVERLFLRDKDTTGLAEFYRKRIKVEPNNFPLVCRYVTAIVQAGRIDEAKHVLADTTQKLQTVDADDLPTMVSLAHLFDVVGMPEDAEAMLRKAANTPSDDPKIDEQLATSLRFDSLLRLYNKPGTEAATVQFYARTLLEQPEIAQQPKRLDEMFGEEKDANLRNVSVLAETLKRLIEHTKQQSAAQQPITQHTAILQQTVALLEKRLAHSQNSLAYLMQKAEQFLAEGRADEAETVIEKIANIIPRQPAAMLKYAALLDHANQTQVSLRWKDSAFRIDPQLFFQDDSRCVREYERQNAIDRLCDLIRSFDETTQLQYAECISGIIDGMMGNRLRKTAAMSLFDDLWHKTFDDKSQSLQYKTNLLKGMIWNSRKELFPYYREIVLQQITPAADANGASSSNNAEFCNPHWVVAWGSDQCRSLSFALLATLPDEETTALTNEVDQILRRYESTDFAQRDWSGHVYATVLKALIELKTDQTEQAFDRLNALGKNEYAIMPLIDSGAILGQEFAGLPEKKYKRFAIECFQKYQRVNQHSYGEVYLSLQLSQLQAQLAEKP